MSTARERLERIQVNGGRDRYRGRSLIHEHDWQWLLRIAEAAIEAHESGALRYPTTPFLGSVLSELSTVVHILHKGR